eukprot:TRINITY_DN122057_c0_g1_i1.p2 TRINITY_DN122057_c0_g1~~TRINITY_DN122057_c0_g1_i1.p2  ORF type:complete len:400 (+),score=7.72 TRINITY_DN122057_c0_g1_i1:102-1202(+)
MKRTNSKKKKSAAKTYRKKVSKPLKTPPSVPMLMPLPSKIASKPSRKSKKSGCSSDASPYIYRLVPSSSSSFIQLYNLETKGFQSVTFSSNFPYNEPATCLIGNTIYFTGGRSEKFPALPTAFCLHISAEPTFSTLPGMVVARYLHCAVARKNAGEIVVIGGFGNSSSKEPLSSCERFSIKRNKWESAENLVTARARAAACECNTSIYVFGGVELGLKGNFELARTVEVFSGEGWTEIVMVCGEIENLWNGKVATGVIGVSETEIMIVGGSNKVDVIEGDKEVYAWDSETECVTKLDANCEAGEEIALNPSLKLWKNAVYFLAGERCISWFGLDEQKWHSTTQSALSDTKQLLAKLLRKQQRVIKN